MNLAYISPNMFSGGTEQVTLLLSNAFLKKSYNVKIFVLQNNENQFKNVRSEIVDLSKLPELEKFFYLKNELEKFDFIFINYYLNENFQYSYFAFFIAYLYYPYKTFVTCHNNYLSFHLSSNKKFSYYLNSLTPYVISICGAMSDNIKKEYKLENLKTIYNPTDMKYINSLVNEDLDEDFLLDKSFILAVGRLEYQKNFDSLIRAYKKTKLKEKSIKLLILGDGSNFNSLKSLIKKLSLGDVVLLLKNKDNPYKYMKRALFLVMSSRFEGFPMVLGEALACGIPVLSYDIQTGPNEMIIHEQNGLLVKNQDEDELAKSISRMFFDKELYNKCKSNAVGSIKKFDIDNIILEWEYLIEQNFNKNDNLANKNPFGEFEKDELINYFSCSINYYRILDFINNIKNIDEFENFCKNIFDFIKQYCYIFKNISIKEELENKCLEMIYNSIFLSKLEKQLKKKILNNFLNSYNIINKKNHFLYSAKQFIILPNIEKIIIISKKFKLYAIFKKIYKLLKKYKT